MGNPTFRAVAAREEYGLTPPDLVIPKPTGTVSGDVLVAMVRVEDDLTGNPVTSSGWTSRVNELEDHLPSARSGYRHSYQGVPR